MLHTYNDCFHLSLSLSLSLSLFRSLLPDLIVTELLDPEATCLPSPNQLKRRVLIKHKKLEVNDKSTRMATLQKHSSSTASIQKTSSSGSIQIDEDIEAFMSDLSNQRMNGYLYMQDPIDKVSWRGDKHMPLLINFVSGDCSY